MDEMSNILSCNQRLFAHVTLPVSKAKLKNYEITPVTSTGVHESKVRIIVLQEVTRFHAMATDR